jgi:hypothetical protein
MDMIVADFADFADLLQGLPALDWVTEYDAFMMLL